MSFAARRPQGGNFYVAANFQRSTDSEASAASRQEMGFESLIRFSYDLPTNLMLGNQSLPISFGVQRILNTTGGNGEPQGQACKSGLLAEQPLCGRISPDASSYVAGKENARLIVSQIVLDGLNELKMGYPKITAKRRRELESIRRLLAK
jgi:hypothetical protein